MPFYGITHGAILTSQEGAILVILPIQQPSTPPGRPLQPVPPHFPHELRQHARLLSSNIPSSHNNEGVAAGSSIVIGSGVGSVVGSGVGSGKSVTETPKPLKK